MPYDVFISHSSGDKLTADATVAALEADGIRCWVAPRDVIPGVQWASAIVQAIVECRMMVLVFSSETNDSHHIVREVELAAHHRKPIIPLRVENALPSSTLDYYIAGTHWLDAIDPPLEAHLDRLSTVVKGLLEREASDGPTDGPLGAQVANPRTGAVAASTAGSDRKEEVPGNIAVLEPPTPISIPVVEGSVVTPPTTHEPTFPPAPPAPEERAFAAAAPPPPERRSTGLIVLLAGLLVLAAGGVAAAVILSGDDGATEASPTSAAVETPTPSTATGATGGAAVKETTVRAPQHLHREAVLFDQVRLSWDPAPFGAAVDHYLVLRDGEKIASVDDRSFSDDSVAPSHRYVYLIVAVGVDGSRASSKELEVTTPAAPAPPPSSPPTSSGNPPPVCDGIVTPAGECIPWS